MTENHTLLTQYDVDGVAYTVYEAASATSGPASGKRWYRCHLCAMDFREDQVMLIGGAAYCIPNRCYEEMVSD